MKEVKFFYCEVCGNLTYLLNEGPGEMVCCNQPMTLLVAGVTDAATEKHVPFVTRESGKIDVVVGEVEHPMIPQHYITWIAAVQGDSVKFVHLHPGEPPKASFCVEEGPVTVYEYCNLHGLWMAEA
ncbi:MAG: desulfoferrodoxin family protein [Eubacteriales bacterium]|jgi:superoxide reductase|nr:desulfoferrodoxin family protein [Eubacteriales bacterium]